MRIFVNPEEHRLRALWRLLLHALLTFALGVLPILFVAEPLTALHRRGLFLPGLGHDSYDRVINMIVGPLLAAAVIAAVAIAARRLDHRPLSDLGVVLDRRWWTSLAGGFTLGALLMLFVFAVEWSAGWIDVTAGRVIPLAFAFTIVKVLCVGTYEEFVSHGYQLRNLAEGTNVAIAVVVSSTIFAALHATNDNASVLSTIGLFVNGVLFAVAALATGRLSTAIGLHMAWNLFEGLVLGFPVSGDKEGASLIAIRQLGPDLLTGGAFGPEAGVPGIAASLLGIIALVALGKSPGAGPAAEKHRRRQNAEDRDRRGRDHSGGNARTLRRSGDFGRPWEVLDRRDERVSAARQRADIARHLGPIAEREPDPADRGIDAVLEVDVLLPSPDGRMDLVARNDPAGMLHEQEKNAERLVREENDHSRTPQLPGGGIELEGSEPQQLVLHGTSVAGSPSTQSYGSKNVHRVMCLHR